VAEQIVALAQPGRLLLVQGNVGCGRTTVLRAVHEALGGAFLSAADFLEPQLGNEPFKFDELVFQVLARALRDHDVVFVDDFGWLMSYLDGYDYLRHDFVQISLAALARLVVDHRKCLLLGDTDQCPYLVTARSHVIEIPELTREDQEFLFRAQLGEERADGLDFEEIWRFAPKLDGHQITLTCQALAEREPLTTQDVTDFVLTRFSLDSNVDLEQVEEVQFSDLKGLDEVLEQLETHVLMPLHQSELARELGVRPKRGVLLYGPPGTGKTSIGRALAHHLGAKFLLIDGQLIANGCGNFFQKVHNIFQAAHQHAPSIVFLDDSDVLFKHADEEGEISGFYRYLLAQLDGLHSQGRGDVCVIMTAMDVQELPAALVRSGRIDLWLEIKLPEEAAREAILWDRSGDLLEKYPDLDLSAVAKESDGFTGADLRRVVEDARNLLGRDLLASQPPEPLTAYFLCAINGLRENKRRYKEIQGRMGFR
jgi:ATP-dependent 26S proteasome regulatory subunit